MTASQKVITKKYLLSFGEPFPDRVLQVCAVPTEDGDVEFGIFYYIKRRHKSKALPICKTLEDCQNNLNDYAAKNGLEEVFYD